MKSHFLVGVLLLLSGSANADPPAASAGATLSPARRFSEQTGEALYVNVCQACHMSTGEGALGAGRYPPLARNEKLASGGYVVHVVLNGQKAMPPFARSMSDEQVAAVANYVRRHFGNDYPESVSADDVKNAR